jgi:steroid 5-alpha reductase family enzyme
MEAIKNNRTLSILIIVCIYVMAGCVGIVCYRYLDFPFWVNLLVADAIATVFVFIFSVVFKNASVYDPYWSVQPIVIIVCFAMAHKMTSAALLLLVSIVYWGIRLTLNWAIGFGGLNHQDWRYTKLQNDNGRMYPLINFTGIHMMPTFWWLIAGAVANTVLFFTVSIPMADKRQSSKPGYAEYKASTRMLLPIPK